MFEKDFIQVEESKISFADLVLNTEMDVMEHSHNSYIFLAVTAVLSSIVLVLISLACYAKLSRSHVVVPEIVQNRESFSGQNHEELQERALPTENRNHHGHNWTQPQHDNSFTQVEI